MVTTGFSKPYVAKYNATGQTVTYSGGISLGRGVSLSLEVETPNDNNFYADNELAESESTNFTSGTANITVDGLENAAATLILGLGSPQPLQVDDTPVQMQGYGKSMEAPYVGYGCVRRTQMQGKVQYWPYILPKVKFSIPGDEIETSEDQINWQTQELSAAVQRDDTAAANWKLISKEGMATEAEAEAAVKAFLNITEEDE